jgi:phenylalanyl-tRNA synthetase alpha chain
MGANLKNSWTEIQRSRLIELQADGKKLGLEFGSENDRNRAFQELEKKLVRVQRGKLEELRTIHRRPKLCRLESRLTEVLIQNDFVQVTTPTIMSKGLLAKMSIGVDHPLNSQIFWLDNDQCLRPMLAPHLYYVLIDLLRLWEKPVCIFEVGPCFRKESQGSRHANEFTMLNLVEMGLPAENRQTRLEELTALIATTAGIEDYFLQVESSAVYGETMDILAGQNQVEIGSSAFGPHPLDRAWKVTDAWVGIGFGLERLLMVSEKSESLARMGKSLAYLDGVRLNI